MIGLSYKRTYMPASYHIAQEIQKYNIPDYRPRQEQSVHSAPFELRTVSSYPCFLPADSKKPSRKYALYNVCGGIVGLLSVRRRIPHGRTSRGLYGRTTPRKQIPGLQVISCRGDGSRAVFNLSRLCVFVFVLDARTSASLSFSVVLLFDGGQ